MLIVLFQPDCRSISRLACCITRLHLRIHRCEIEQDSRLKVRASGCVETPRPPGSRRKADTDLAEVVNIRRVAGREKRVCERAQRHPIVKGHGCPERRCSAARAASGQPHTRRTLFYLLNRLKNCSHIGRQDSK
jgi:hypothetical protein